MVHVSFEQQDKVVDSSNSIFCVCISYAMAFPPLLFYYYYIEKKEIKKLNIYPIQIAEAFTTPPFLL